jgi:hypothetical protein
MFLGWAVPGDLAPSEHPDRLPVEYDYHDVITRSSTLHGKWGIPTFPVLMALTRRGRGNEGERKLCSQRFSVPTLMPLYGFSLSLRRRDSSTYPAFCGRLLTINASRRCRVLVLRLCWSILERDRSLAAFSSSWLA